MNATETGKIMYILKAAYPMYYSKISAEEQKAIFALWLDLFKEDDVRIVGAAVKALIATDNKGFPPVIGQVKDKMHSLMYAGIEAMTESEAWAMVKKAIRNGYYGADEEFKKFPASIQRIVGSPNQLREWAIMDSSEIDTVVASNFQRGFRNIEARTKEAELLPASVKNMVAQLANGMANKMIEGG